MTQSLRIGIAGLGTVGMGVVTTLQKQYALLRARAGCEIEVVAVSAKRNIKRTPDVSSYRFENDPLALAKDPNIDVVVELIGGAEGTAHALAEATLAAGKHLVTANKALIATHGAALAKLAEDKRVSLCFEAAVAGGIPILKLLREGLTANQVTRVMGILNGTCNYILTHMWEDRREFDDVLAEAQKLGYAEADPSFDVDGVDTAHKLAILTSLAFGKAPDLSSLAIAGIRGISLRDMQFADELGYTIRLLGVASATSQRVYPALVAKDSDLASVRGVFNAVQVECGGAGTLFIQGRGAGGLPTASAVIADIIDIARKNSSPPFGKPSAALAQTTSATATDRGEHYIRLAVIDKPGVLADITSAFRDAGISLKSFIQHGQAPEEKIYIAVTTHETGASDLERALVSIGKQTSIQESPFSMRIES